MKRLNNKGFAISTLLYSMIIMVMMIVMIMMSIMATTRKSTKELSETIEQELTGYAATEAEFTGVGSQSFIAPQAGWYKVEYWSITGPNTYNAKLYYLAKNTTFNFTINSTSVTLTSGFTPEYEKSSSPSVTSSRLKIRLVSTNESSEPPVVSIISNGELKNGKYYISKTGTYDVLTVNPTNGSVSFQPLNGDKTQEWIIEVVKDPSTGDILYYKIISSATGLLLAPQEETGAEGTTVTAETNSTMEYNWIKWTISDTTGIGEYAIQTQLSTNTLTHDGSFKASPTTDYLFNFIYSEY